MASSSPAHDDSNPPAASTIWHNIIPLEIEQPSLPPTDTGKAAWLVLAGCSLIQAPVWGFSLAFGVFQEYYASHPEAIQGDTSNIAIVGTSMTGIMYLSSPLTFTLLTKYPHLRRSFGPLGVLIAASGFLLSSFATKVWQLIVTQGVLCALGCGLMFTPTTLYLDEWWVRRKGLAYGIMWSGKNVTGIVMPFVVEAGLGRFGPRRTVQAWAVGTVLLSAPLLYFLRPRLPLPQSSAPRRIDTSFLRLPAFWMHSIGNVLQSLGYFLPYTYLTSYAVQQLQLSTTVSTLLLAVINASSIPGGIVIGSLGDHFSVTSVVLVSTIGSAVAVLCFWGLSSHVALLTIFAITYGFFAGGFSSTWSGVLTNLKEQSPTLDTGFIFGLLAGGRGIGNVISGPLSVALLGGGGVGGGKVGGGYGGEYGWLILFTGITSVLGGWGWLERYC
ncbi:major facilitator superfamily domain-containing protein [Dendryphion nanum]|uniref:Major facilitator superfamily domain-containing protein n=1 Tax=Dendryphion nanum TaxID=256645 RepID=A0A9P9EE15_9PLEO|nr:major facilitator superfamily domain-containing protein [Dendryphion nanum]